MGSFEAIIKYTVTLCTTMVSQHVLGYANVTKIMYAQLPDDPITPLHIFCVTPLPPPRPRSCSCTTQQH